METGGAEHTAPVVFCVFYGGGGVEMLKGWLIAISLF